MRRDALQFDLPPELIAQQPAEPRDASRLLVLHRQTGRIEHRRFRDVLEYLHPNDCLVRNDTRVIAARFWCRRHTGGRVEALFLRAEPHSEHGPPAALQPRWRVLLRPSARLQPGQRLAIPGAHATLLLIAPGDRGEWTVAPDPPVPPLELLERVGEPPLPPYIRRADATPDPGARIPPLTADRERYQTVYAAAPGAVAAPTAGLHFTPALLGDIERRGLRIADVTLHVGVGTFAPITADELADHVMHAEWYEVDEPAAAALNAAARLVAVGTTSLRVIETLAPGRVQPARGWTDLFIYPPYEFRRTGALLTNFHLPGSTLLALVMAFAGIENAGRAYATAIAERYRFYSYGDAMLIL